MAKTQITREQLVNRLVEVYSNEELTEEYNSRDIIHQGLCGWTGQSMAPLTRPAYIAAFGEIAVLAAETAAREIISAKQQEWKQTNYYQYSQQADMTKETGNALIKGAFYWMQSSGIKHDGWDSVIDEIKCRLMYNDERKNVLCKVVEVVEVTEEQFRDGKWLAELCESSEELRKTGGACSEDVEGKDYWQLSKEDKETFFVCGFAVYCGGKWFLIDTEGYDYPRYMYLTSNYATMLADEFKAAQEDIEAERRKKEEEEAAALAERKAEYDAACSKWQPLMTDVRPLVEKLNKYDIYSKERRDADRAVMNARRHNILAMVQTAFPGVKFSLKHNNGWGHDWTLRWTDGPTEKEFREATDLHLFKAKYDTFDGMTDCAGVSCMEFTDFAKFAIGALTDGDIEFIRERGENYHYNEDFSKNQEEIKRWSETSYYVRPAEKAEKSKTAAVNTEGLSFQIVDYSEKAFAVIGDTREVKELLKEHGGRWNARLTCGAGWIFSSAKTDRVKLATVLGI